jgi:tape measure domain-containing protein
VAEVGSAFLSIVPSVRGMRAALESQMGSDATAAGKTAGTRFGSSFSSAGQAQISALGGIAKWGGVALAGMGVLGAKAGLQTAAAMENAKIAFTTMLGSAQKASVFIKDLGNFAAKTPFEFPELQTAASSLISAGINADKVIPIMTTLGNVTSGMGTGSEGIQRATVALQQMNAAGRITGEDLNQLRDAGIPVYDLLAAATGKTKAEIVKLAQAGKLGKTELDAMMKGLETGKGLERFKGLMAKQSASLGGIWSTFRDNLNMSLSKALTPSLPGIKAGLSAVSAALPGLIKGFADFVTVLFRVGQWIVAHKPVLLGLAAGILTALVPSFVAAAIATWAWTAALLANPLTWIVVGIALLVAAIVLLVQNWDLIKEKTIEVWNAIKAKLAAVWDAIKAKATAIWNGLKAAISAAWDAIKQAIVTKAQAVVDFVTKWAKTFLNIFLFLPKQMLKIGTDIVLGLRDGLVNAWHFVTDKVEALIAKIPLAIRKLMGITSPSKVMAQLGAQMSAGLALGIESGQSDVQSSLRGLTSDLAVNARVSARTGSGVTAPTTVAAPTQFYLKSGAIEIINGKAYITGVINEHVFEAATA